MIDARTIGTAALVLAVGAPLALPASAQETAEVGQIQRDLAFAQQELLSVADRLQQIYVPGTYCQPPENPKEGDRLALRGLLEELAVIERRVTRTRQVANRLLNRPDTANAVVASAPAYQGLSLDVASETANTAYWTAYRRQIAALRASAEQKLQQIARTPVENCRPPERAPTPPANTTGGGETSSAAEVSRLLEGLDATVPDMPTRPSRFCSNRERLRASYEVSRVWLIASNRRYDISQRRRDLTDRLALMPIYDPGEAPIRAAISTIDRELMPPLGVFVEAAKAEREAINATPLTNCGNAAEGGGPEVAIGVGAGGINLPQQGFGKVGVGSEDRNLVETKDDIDVTSFLAELRVKPDGDAGLEFGLGVKVSSGDGQTEATVAAPPGGFTGFVFVDPLDPEVPVPVGIGGPLAFDAQTETKVDRTEVDFTVRQRIDFATSFTGADRLNVTLGVGAKVVDTDVSHTGRLENQEFSDFIVNHAYDVDSGGIGPQFELRVQPPSLAGGVVQYWFDASVAPVFEDQRVDLWQEVENAPVGGTFPYTQRRTLKDDVLNTHYEVGAEARYQLNSEWSLGVRASYSGETDAPTVIPADGSFAPGGPAQLDHEEATSWGVAATVHRRF